MDARTPEVAIAVGATSDAPTGWGGATLVVRKCSRQSLLSRQWDASVPRSSWSSKQFAAPPETPESIPGTWAHRSRWPAASYQLTTKIAEMM